jgi:vancomycin resistance protein YoaR
MIKLLKKEWGISTALLALFLVSLVSLRVSANDIVVSSVDVSGMDLQGMSYIEAGEQLKYAFGDLFAEPLILNLQGDLKTSSLENLGFSLNQELTVAAVYEEVYGSGFIAHLGTRLKDVIQDFSVTPVIEVDKVQFKKEIVNVFPKLMGGKDAKLFVNTEFDLEVIPHEDGVITDFDGLADEILHSLIEGTYINEIEVSVLNDFAEYTVGDAQDDAELLSTYVKKTVRLHHIVSPELKHEYDMQISPTLVTVKNGEINFDESLINIWLENEVAADFKVGLANAVIKEVPAEDDIFAVVEGLAMDGVELDIDKTTEVLVNNLHSGNFKSEIYLKITPAEILNETGLDLGDLELISTGRSGFWGSDWGRKFNIQKGLDEKVNNILLAPDEEYSFNDNLGAVEYSNGWAGAKAIFGGAELITVPGGGLCQVSTTLYRAALGADLEIVERFTHTLYVLYYEEFGNGLDATIYPGFRDFRFKNDSGNYLFIQAYSDEDFGFVNIYGTSEKEVRLIGPIYSGRVPDEYLGEIDPAWNEIGWVKETTHPDGKVEEEFMTSRYRTAPRKLYGLE